MFAEDATTPHTSPIIAAADLFVFFHPTASEIGTKTACLKKQSESR
jgi:hypothetical protein